ncbi:MAG: FMN-binding protein [Candidatus Omnitrophota bacterium]
MIKKLKDVLFILILGSVCTGLLLGVKSYTYPVIARHEERTLKATILDAAGVAYTSDTLKEDFKKNIRIRSENGFVYYLTPDNFYVFEFEGRGLWGLIKGVVTLNKDLETIESIKIISQEETPGLGGRIEEEGFLAQFKKKKVSPMLELVLRRKATKINEIDAISGASISSRALIDTINESVEDFRKKAGK